MGKDYDEVLGILIKEDNRSDRNNKSVSNSEVEEHYLKAVEKLKKAAKDGCNTTTYYPSNWTFELEEALIQRFYEEGFVVYPNFGVDDDFDPIGIIFGISNDKLNEARQMKRELK